MKRFIIILSVILWGCVTEKVVVVDNDDLYVQRRNQAPIVERRYRYYQPTPSIPYAYNDWWWRWNTPLYRPYQRPNVIIIQPKPEAPKQYQKRPDREGNGGVAIPLERRRGRIN